MSNLYNLPKDILVKLLTTIEQNVRKEYTDKILKLSKSSAFLEVCTHPDCDVFDIIEDESDKLKMCCCDCSNIIICSCASSSFWCIKHLSEGHIFHYNFCGISKFICAACVNKDQYSICRGCEKCTVSNPRSEEN